MNKIGFLTVVLIISITINTYSQKYVFLFIGDGMGNAQIDLYESYLANSKDSIGYRLSTISKLPELCMCGTVCKDRQITDSGAAGSAIACGQKFNVGEISYSAEGEQPKSIAKYAKEQGLKVGIITTTSINHATPAAFYANESDRKNFYEIGLQLPKSEFDFFGGGGFYKSTGKNREEKELTQICQEAGYLLFSNLKGIEALENRNSKVIFTNETLERDASIPYAIDRESEKSNSLCEIVETAINYLDNPQGFFMMVEGGKIDFAGHDNDGATMVKEMEDFDNAIAKAYDFYLNHKDETLIIVTADHETGGLSLGTAINEYESDFKVLNEQKMSMYKFGILVKRHTRSNQEMPIREYIALAQKYFYSSKTDFSNYEYSLIRDAFTHYNENPNKNQDEKLILYGGNNPMAVSFCKIINTRASINFSTWNHTCAKVPVFTTETKDKLFLNTMDNTDFYNKIKNFIDK